MIEQDQKELEMLRKFANTMSSILFKYANASENEMLARARGLVNLERQYQIQQKLSVFIEKLDELADLITETRA